MSSPYDDIIQAVNELIGEYGGPATLTANVAGSYDPATGTAPATILNYAVSIIAFDFLQKKDGDAGQGNTLIQSGDKCVYMMSADYIPRPDPKTDFILYNSRQYSIVTVKELNPSGSLRIVTELFIRE